MSIWTPEGTSGTVFIADYDASIDFSELWPINRTNDLTELDIKLESENFTDSISKTYDSDGNDVADETANFDIFSYSLRSQLKNHYL